MATMTIRNLDDDVKARLRVRAAKRGHSMEEEARNILRDAVGVEANAGTGAALVADIRSLVEKFGGVELELPTRGAMREPPDFGG